MSSKFPPIRFYCAFLCLFAGFPVFGEPLPNTRLLEEKGDLAEKMVSGIHKYLDRETVSSVKNRSSYWKIDTSSKEAYEKSIQPNRERFKKIIGLVDDRVKFDDLEYIAGPKTPLVVGETEKVRIYGVRWPVFPGVEGEGLLLEPKGKVIAQVVLIPDSEQLLEQLAGISKENNLPIALQLSSRGCRVVIPTLINRNHSYSGNPKLGRMTNMPHREFIWRMAFEMGRQLVGYEVQKVLSVVDWYSKEKDHPPVGVFGIGQGGQIAFYAGAVDPRIQVTNVCAYFAPREEVWKEPIDRDIWSLLKEFGDAEIAQLVLPRRLIIDPPAEEIKLAKGYWPTWDGPKEVKKTNQAAPGKLWEVPQADVIREASRYQQLEEKLLKKQTSSRKSDGSYDWQQFLGELATNPEAMKEEEIALPKISSESPNIEARQKRQFTQLVNYTQQLWRDSEPIRATRFAKCDVSSPEKWDQSCEAIRNYFWEEVIGKLPKPDQEMNPKSRLIYETSKWKGYEVTLDLYPDVFSYGILLLPNDLKPDEKRPVVVCQHGLEGRPTDICNPKEKTRYYNSFGAQLADRGYIVFAPQNPYIGQHHFRLLQRKGHPLKLSLFAFIIRQHERILDWLCTLPGVDENRIAFYGLSYGGKTAMRVPAVLKKYCLSICSADFNEWIGKNVSVDLPMSYMFSIEYDMPEFDLGTTFNYAEMAYLIAPRPFMVERGHTDGVGIDEMVAYEYAKIRYLYANRLKIPENTTIEFFAGGHEINGKGTFQFLANHLRWPRGK
jgi:cephalosporin-C deacetylase-like acetyl esterase